ncbi:TraX family protein [Helcococcus ovis]|uniref:Conjugal transfer protein TraX n=2 Tax=Helcococcus ovis TaxID=72026 RepID=A0A4R9C2P8_9FIRM|nr:TraX family protein [Helcococcus ovis]TFF64280.1 hypothetical protein EQF92_06390 [Helcococcus ovis]TFF66443.1 hypothetical protein EQF91_03840 [Helcococcus ovis]
MTGFTIKLIAIIAMLIDHVGAYFQLSGSEIIPFQYAFLMRSIGRLALPIFSFFLVEGYLKTKNLKKYIDRLHVFALITQIPFVFLFTQENYMLGGLASNYFTFSYKFEYLIFIAFIIFAYWKYICDEKFKTSLFLILFAYLIVPLKLEYNGYVLLSADNLNIMYELGISLIFMRLIIVIEKYMEYKKYKKLIIPVIALIVSVYFMGTVANYNYNAIMLIMFIFLLRNDKVRQLVLIAVWAIFTYYANVQLAVFAVLSVLFIYLYNQKRGLSVKYLFYIIYPLHIVFISLFKILIK